ncbi:50S ribosomal protein L6 [Candidatus Microgenomates bacterium]|nr:MAG: 50S ribosomal protein L6 [Candidatus Microgenomates bacterium]
MSRIGKSPISIPAGVTVEKTDSKVLVKGPKGTLTVEVPKELKVAIKDTILTVEVMQSEQNVANKHGLVRSLIYNAVYGVTKGWEKKLELIGVGYRAQGSGRELNLTVGFSHPVKFTADEGISFTVSDNTKITVSGIDKKTVGEVAASVRKVRPPEPYKGKGIRYQDEVVRKKAGKAVKAASAG